MAVCSLHKWDSTMRKRGHATNGCPHCTIEHLHIEIQRLQAELAEVRLEIIITLDTIKQEALEALKGDSDE